MRSFLLLALLQTLPAGGIPALVRQAVDRRFPGAAKIEWKRKTDGNYEAEFTWKGVGVAAKFDSTGQWVETESDLRRSALPRAVARSIAARYASYRVIETQRLVSARDTRVVYEVHLQNAKEVLKTQFDSTGSLLAQSTKPRAKG
jgi:hypothetical protein